VTRAKRARILQVAVESRPPQVPYQETLRGHARRVEGKLDARSGGRGPFAACHLSVEPGPRGSGVVFLDEIEGGAIPPNHIAAVERGVRESCERGILAGFPVTDIRVHCVGGEFHAIDSSEQAFRSAAGLALQAAFQQAQPVLLEPVLKLRVAVPDEFVGDVMGDLHARRGRVSDVEAAGPTTAISADVPLAEVLSYATDLGSLSAGQGSFTMEFSHYEEVPKEIEERIVAEAGAQRASD
jgi:elongation factor G